MKRKGQVSIEFLIIVGFAFLLSVPLLIIFFKQSETMNAEISGTQADKVANEIRDAADEVYYLGAPSKKTLLLSMPKEVNAVTLIGTSIIFNISSAYGNYEVVKWSVANFSEESRITPGSGLRRISITAETRTENVNGTAVTNTYVIVNGTG